MKIYTKTGDKGQTSLVGGLRVSKGCDRLESYGTVDELNSQLGLLITYCKEKSDVSFLTDVQRNIFVVGSYLATDNTQTKVKNIVTAEMVETLEKEIDRIDSILPPQKLFILPGGSRSSSVAHVCRCVCRRAERCIIRLAEDGVEIDDNVVSYINRLSDYLFILARKLNYDENHEEIIWKR